MPARAIVRQRKFRRRGGVEGYAKRILAAERRGNARVKVGLPRGSGEYPDGTPVVLVGIIHEFGAPEINIPMRSFLRAAMAEGSDELKAAIRKLARAVLEGETSERAALETLGTLAASMVQAKIIEGPFEANQPATIARKGSSSPLNDTGQLRQAVTWEVAS